MSMLPFLVAALIAIWFTGIEAKEEGTEQAAGAVLDDCIKEAKENVHKYVAATFGDETDKTTHILQWLEESDEFQDCSGKNRASEIVECRRLPEKYKRRCLGAPNIGVWNFEPPGIVTDDMLLVAAKAPNDWILYGKDYAHTRYSQLDEINTKTIQNLVPKWVLSFGVLDSQGSQTLALNGNLFVSSSYNHVFRVDGRTGRTVWRYDHPLPGDVFPHLCCDVINRGPALYGTNLYVATLDGHLVALDSASGQVIWDQTVADYKSSYSFTVLPLAVDGKIIIGTSGAEFGIRGFITARDAETGEEVWKTHTIPAPGEPGGDTWPGDTYKYGGGSAWVTGAYDPELNNIYWGVGQPGPWDRHAHPGDNLYTNSTIVLDPDSGAIKFHFQYTPNDPYDYDGVNETVLADIDGQKVWLHADRNGHFYSIDRTNGSFNYAVPLGKVTWNRGFDPETGRPIFAYPEMDVTRDKVTEGIYPALFGGKEWNPMAYNPETQIAYVPSFGDHSMDLQAKVEKYTRGESYLGIKVMKWYGGGGELRAIDARNGELVWVHNNPMPFRSSVTATAGNLVFAGDTEGYIKAFNATTGAQVWSFYCGSSVMGGVNTFTIDGKQYLTVVVGQAQTGIEMFDENWKKTHQKGGHLIAFALHKSSLEGASKNDSPSDKTGVRGSVASWRQ